MSSLCSGYFASSSHQFFLALSSLSSRVRFVPRFPLCMYIGCIYLLCASLWMRSLAHVYKGTVVNATSTKNFTTDGAWLEAWSSFDPVRCCGGHMQCACSLQCSAPRRSSLASTSTSAPASHTCSQSLLERIVRKAHQAAIITTFFWEKNRSICSFFKKR